jgi:hypothetical protein
MAEMFKIVSAAKKRRAKYLSEYNKLKVNEEWTITKFAKLKGMTRARMSQLLLKAIQDEIGRDCVPL